MISPKNPKGAGRPALPVPAVRVNLILDAETIAKLKSHGYGNMSLAVRLLAASL